MAFASIEKITQNITNVSKKSLVKGLSGIIEEFSCLLDLLDAALT